VETHRNEENIMTTFTIKTTRTFHRGLATTTFDLPEFQIEASTRVQACLHAGSILGKDSEEVTHEITVHEYPTSGLTDVEELALYDSLPDFDPSL